MNRATNELVYTIGDFFVILYQQT